jgi:tetratricopeptide (TPR) repeat protein
MEKQTDIIGYIGLGISGIGAIASILTNNIAMASIPLTVGIGCNVFSRKQHYNSLVEAYNLQEQSINDILQKLEVHSQQVQEQLLNHHRELGNSLEVARKSINDSLEAQKKNFVQEIKRIDLRYEDLTQLVETIESVQNLSQNISNEKSSAKFYYDRGIGYEKLGNKEGALKDYTEAIKLDSTLAQAYHKRGIIYLEQENQQKAVDDLRKAALLYFEQGDIDSYHQAREMSRNIHDLRNSGNGHMKEQIVVGNNLFS